MELHARHPIAEIEQAGIVIFFDDGMGALPPEQQNTRRLFYTPVVPVGKIEVPQPGI